MKAAVSISDDIFAKVERLARRAGVLGPGRVTSQLSEYQPEQRVEHHRGGRGPSVAIAERRTGARVLHLVGQGTPRRQAFMVDTAPVGFGGAAIRDETRKLDPQMPVEFERASAIVNAGLNRHVTG